MAAEKLRDLSQPIDVTLLDATVESFYATGSKDEVSQFAYKLLIDERTNETNRFNRVLCVLILLIAYSISVCVLICFQRAAADNILRELKANPDTWLQVVHILQSTRSTHTKYFALQVKFWLIQLFLLLGEKVLMD